MKSPLQPHIDKLNALFVKLETIYPEYKTHFKPQLLRKGDFLQQEGAVCNHFWMVEQGLLRCFLRKEATEVVTYFWFPGDYIYSTQSYLLQTPCKDNIQALTDALVYSMSRENFDDLCSRYPIIQNIREVMMELHTMWMEERLLSLQCCSAQERYEKLLQTDLKLIREIPLAHVASYLGITFETLSRIRARIHKK